MKIGILTFHYAHNYGAVLQCYALQKFLEDRGHVVSVIDYRAQTIADIYRLWNWNYLFSKKIRVFLSQLLLFRVRKKRFNNFSSFVSEKLHLCTMQEFANTTFDIVYIGSDQVWNNDLTGGFDNYYWGNFEHSDKTTIVSYGASMRDDLSENETKKVASLLGNFDFISVRESTLAKNLKNLTGRKIFQVVDPTLLLEVRIWKELAQKPHYSEPYLLLYQVEGNNEKTIRIAEAISKSKKIPILRISTFVDRSTSKTCASASPLDFLGLILYSAFVVCSSFHGTVFSILFNKPFISVRMGAGKDNRVGNFLNQLGLLDHFVDIYNPQFDYSIENLDGKINDLRNKSINFIDTVESKCSGNL